MFVNVQILVLKVVGTVSTHPIFMYCTYLSMYVCLCVCMCVFHNQVLNSWNELRTEFQTCNSRKAIAPTQFNPMSTRGHCIMVLEVEMPGETEVSCGGKFIIYSFMYVCMCMFICVYVCICMYVCMYVYVYMCVCMYVYVCMYICVCMYVYMCVCMYVCM